MEFVDRKEELQELKRVLEDSPSPSFVVVYGRRRLGKSTLLKKALKQSDVFYMAGDFIETVQLKLIKEHLSNKFPLMKNINISSWEDLFNILNSLTTEIFTLCLDEFPYIVKHSPGLPSVLQRFIDSKELKFNIVVCGSSQRMMHKLVLSYAEPLYGRAKAIIKLSPIAIPYLQEVLKSDAISTVEEYSVWGGVPRYWELREEYHSLMEAIQGTMLSTISILYDEPRRLFLDDLTSAVQSESLMAVIAGGANKLSEIASRMGRDATALSAPLDRLIQMNYLRREIPFGENPKKSKKSLYKIADPFMNFYFTFIIPNLSFIARGRKNLVLELIKENLNAYISYFWEYLCQEAVTGNFLFDHRWKEASRWWGSVQDNKEYKQLEVDVVAESMDGEAILIGECKWTNPEIAGSLFANLENKISLLPFTQDKKIIPVLFLKNRPKDSADLSKCHILYPEDIIKLSYSD